MLFNIGGYPANDLEPEHELQPGFLELHTRSRCTAPGD
jgi:hypothetical protein